MSALNKLNTLKSDNASSILEKSEKVKENDRRNSMDGFFSHSDVFPHIDASQMKDIDKLKVERMRLRIDKKRHIFYPEDKTKI
jgi:hypothetical protein